MMGSKWVFKDFSSALENKTQGFLMLSRQLGQNYQVLVLTPKLENSEFLKPSPGPSGKACTHTRPKEEGSISRNGADTHPLPRRQQQTQHIPCHSWCFLSSALAWPTFFFPAFPSNLFSHQSLLLLISYVSLLNHFNFIVKSEKESEITQSCLTLCDPMDYSQPAPPSMGFSRHEYWSGVPFPLVSLELSQYSHKWNFAFAIIFDQSKNISSSQYLNHSTHNACLRACSVASVVTDSLRAYGLKPTSLSCP